MNGEYSCLRRPRRFGIEVRVMMLVIKLESETLSQQSSPVHFSGVELNSISYFLFRMLKFFKLYLLFSFPVHLILLFPLVCFLWGWLWDMSTWTNTYFLHISCFLVNDWALESFKNHLGILWFLQTDIFLIYCTKRFL